MHVSRSEFRGRQTQHQLNSAGQFRGLDGFEMAGAETDLLAVEVAELGCESVRLGRLVSSGHRYRYNNAAEDWIGLALPVAGRVSAHTGSGTIHADPGQWMSLAPGHRDVQANGYRNDPFQSRRVLISSSSLEAYVASSGMVVGRRLRDVVVPPSSEAAALEDAVLSSLELHPWQIDRPSLANLEARIIELVAEMLQRAGAFDVVRIDRPAPIAKLRAAEEYIRAHAAEHILISDVARELDVSVRGLQEAFRRNRAISPLDYLERVRLQIARQRLLTLQVGEDVTSIALESGIRHLGRFSRRYRQRYGEKPSETVRRVRATTAGK